MRPPSAFHTATTDGRGWVSPPSGQCETGASADAPSSSPGCCTHQHPLLGDDRPAGLAACGHGEELLGLTAPLTFERHREQPVIGFQRVAVGGNPQVAVRVEGHVVGAGDRADLGLVEPAVVGVGGGRITADQQQRPGELGALVIVDDLEDLPVLVLDPRVGLVDSRPCRLRRACCCWSARRRPCRSSGWPRSPRGGPSWWRPPCHPPAG